MNKNKIIDVVINMITRGNVDTISMSKIAKEAGIGKSTIYEHFNSKEELMLMAAESLIKQYADLILNCKYGANIYETFYNHMIVAVKIGKEVFQLFEMSRENCISFLATEEIKEIAEKGILDVLKRFDEIFDKAIKEGVIKPKRDLSKQKYIIYGLLKGSFLCNVGENAVSDEQFIKDIYENLLIILNN